MNSLRSKQKPRPTCNRQSSPGVVRQQTKLHYKTLEASHKGAAGSTQVLCSLLAEQPEQAWLVLTPFKGGKMQQKVSQPRSL